MKKVILVIAVILFVVSLSATEFKHSLGFAGGTMIYHNKRVYEQGFVPSGKVGSSFGSSTTNLYNSGGGLLKTLDSWSNNWVSFSGNVVGNYFINEEKNSPYIGVGLRGSINYDTGQNPAKRNTITDEFPKLSTTTLTGDVSFSGGLDRIFSVYISGGGSRSKVSDYFYESVNSVEGCIDNINIGGGEESTNHWGAGGQVDVFDKFKVGVDYHKNVGDNAGKWIRSATGKVGNFAVSPNYEFGQGFKGYGLNINYNKRGSPFSCYINIDYNEFDGGDNFGGSVGCGWNF